MNQLRTVGPNTSKLSPKTAPFPVSIRNVGVNVVYLDDFSSPGVESFPLFPGDIATWKQGRDCYAWCPGGNQLIVVTDSLDNTVGLGTVQLDPGSMVGITGTVPIAGNVGITGTPSVTIPGTVTTVVPDVIVTGTLSTVGGPNGSIVIPLQGRQGVAFRLDAGTLIGGIVPQLSYDGGAHWVGTQFWDPLGQTAVGSITFSGNNPQENLVIVGVAGATHARVAIFTLTSGSANGQLTATMAASGPVGVTNTPGVNVSNTPNVGITGVPTFSIDPVTNTIKVATGQSIGVSGNVGISGTPNVGIATGVPDASTTGTLGPATFLGWVNLGGRSGFAWTIRGDLSTLVGTLHCLASIDGANAFEVPMYDPTTGNVSTSIPVTSGAWLAGIALVPPGAVMAAVQLTSYTSGTATVTLAATDASGHPVSPTDQPDLNPSGSLLNGTRLISASSAASVNGSVSSSGSIVAAPGAGKYLELHEWSLQFEYTGITSGGDATWDLHTAAGGTLASIACPKGPSGSHYSNQLSGDFQGVLLPVNTALNYTASAGGGGNDGWAINIAYSIVS